MKIQNVEKILFGDPKAKSPIESILTDLNSQLKSYLDALKATSAK